MGSDYEAAQRQRQRQQNWERRRELTEADRERHHIDDLRMKALAEQSKGHPGVWTAEYARAQEEIAARAAAQARARKGCLIALAAIIALGLVIVGIASALNPEPDTYRSTARPQTSPVPTPAKKHKP